MVSHTFQNQVARIKDRRERRRERVNLNNEIKKSVEKEVSKALPIIAADQFASEAKKSSPSNSKPETEARGTKDAVGKKPDGQDIGRFAKAVDMLRGHIHEEAIRLIMKAHDKAEIRAIEWAQLRYAIFLMGGQPRERHFIKWVALHTPLHWNDRATNHGGETVGAFVLPRVYDKSDWKLDFLKGTPFWEWTMPRNEDTPRKKKVA